MLPFCRALFNMIYTACLGAIVSKRSSSRPPELNFFNSAKGLHHPTINIQFKSRPLQKQHEPFVSLGRVLLAGMMLTRPNISSYITRGKGAWREIGVRVLFLGRAHTWWRCVRQMCTCPTHTCSSGQLPRIRQQSGAAPHQGICSIDPAVPRTCPHRPLPSLPSTSCPRIRHLQLLLQETDRMPLLV